MNDEKKNNDKDTDLNEKAFNIVKEATKEKSDSEDKKGKKQKSDE